MITMHINLGTGNIKYRRRFDSSNKVSERNRNLKMEEGSGGWRDGSVTMVVRGRMYPKQWRSVMEARMSSHGSQWKDGPAAMEVSGGRNYQSRGRSVQEAKKQQGEGCVPWSPVPRYTTCQQRGRGDDPVCLPGWLLSPSSVYKTL